MTIKNLLLSSALLSLPLAAFAQTPEPISAEDDLSPAINDEIVVTGSRIARDPNLASPVPVQSLDEEAFRLSGELNLADVVNDVPALVASTTAENSLTGANALNLRGLGTDRTLTLVNGRRHVAGFEGSGAVDIGSIPTALVERVEVLTGGASAIYGADAVTGVVNFILKEDFEGIDADLRGGISGEGDAEFVQFSAAAGKNFANDRGNVVVSVDYQEDSALRFGDRDWARNNLRARSLPNPALRFQNGDLTGDTPNFGRFYNFDNTGRFPYGFLIPSADDFIAAYTAEFGVAPSLTAAERALIDRAAGAPSRAILPQPTFSISSNAGVISPGNFEIGNFDINGNGTPDCLESFVGFNNSLDATGSFGFAGGCWTVNPDGTIRTYEDGLVAANFNQFGGDGIRDDFDEDFLLPETDKVIFNLNSRYELSPGLDVFVEGKYSLQETRTGGPLNTFYDLLQGSPDNPFLPEELQPVADATGALFITRDPTDLGPNIDEFERETIRFVGGLEGQLDNGWNFEIAANYGEFNLETTDNNFVLLDRFFAAIDVVEDAAGNPVCRSSLDPTAVPPTTIFGIPAFDAGFFTFTPGDGQCQPANIWGGPQSISPQAVDFITTTVVDELTIDQTVLSAIFTGDSSAFGFELPAGPIGMAVGAEYRREQSSNVVNPFDRGILPAGTPFAAGQPVSAFSGNQSLGFNAEGVTNNSSGRFDVREVFAELSVPVLRGAMFAEELTLDAAFRYADYSTLGGADTWKVGATWAPVSDLSFRGTISQAIRAPNINELFSPQQPATFRPVDPCDVTELGNGPDEAVRTANCQALGAPAGYTDPLSARFLGVAGGNPDLDVETADTITIGGVIQPRFVPGLSVTVDYWKVDIEDGIVAPSAQDIVDACVDDPGGIDNQFCALIVRETDTTSPQFFGFRSLTQIEQNFAALEAEGVDFAASYGFDLAGFDIDLRAVGTRQIGLDFFVSPTDPDFVNPELGEIQRPKWSGNATVNVGRGPWQVGVQGQYQSKQALGGVEIETIERLFGEAGFSDDVYIFDANGSYELTDTFTVYGGVNNIADKEPFITEEAWPVGPRGRFFFLGVNARY